MKAFLVLALVFLSLGCKKENAADNITAYNWVLETAVINPAITIGSKTGTDYKNLQGEGSCLASNYTMIFLSTGIFQISSNGALCDMVANTKDQKWAKEKNKITLTGNNYLNYNPLIVDGNTMVQTNTFTQNNVNYTVVYTYKAKIK